MVITSEICLSDVYHRRHGVRSARNTGDGHRRSEKGKTLGPPDLRLSLGEERLFFISESSPEFQRDLGIVWNGETFLALNHIYYPADPGRARFQESTWGKSDLFVSPPVSSWRRTEQCDDGRHGSHSCCVRAENNAKCLIINHILSQTRCPTSV